MYNYIYLVWVKNVNILRTGHCVTCGIPSPISVCNIRFINNICGQLQVIQRTVHIYTSFFSPYKFPFFKPLIAGYPHNPQGLLLEPLKRI